MSVRDELIEHLLADIALSGSKGGWLNFFLRSRASGVYSSGGDGKSTALASKQQTG